MSGFFKKTFGTKNDKNTGTPDKASSPDALNVLILGETGAGKSTFINILTNFFLKGTLRKPRVAIPTAFLAATEQWASCENDVKDRGQAQTNDCTTYRFRHNNHTMQFIDTPGLSDPRGIEQDDLNLQKIVDAIGSVDTVCAIVVIVNGTNTRMTVNLRNVFVRLRGVLPDALFGSLIVVFTNCLEHTRNFQLENLRDLRPKIIYHMNNTAFSSDPKKWTGGALQSLQLEWDLSMETVDNLSVYIQSLAVKSTAAFRDMRQLRFAIKQALHEVQIKIANIQRLQDEISAAETALGQYAYDSEQFKNFTRTRTIEQRELVDSQYHSTLCSDCTHVCHDNCGLDEINEKGSNAFKKCAAMSLNNNDNCGQCPGRCSYSSHYHARKLVMVTMMTLEDTIVEIKAKFDAAQSGQQETEQKASTVRDAKDAIEKAIRDTVQSLHNECERLKKICSGFNLVDELHPMLTQLRMEARMLRSAEARTTADAFVRSLEQICDTLTKSGGAGVQSDWSVDDLVQHNFFDRKKSTAAAAPASVPDRDRAADVEPERGAFSARPAYSTAAAAYPTGPYGGVAAPYGPATPPYGPVG
eukprot:TRINITY_DN5781_c0_g1_i1.p2 TRINITY_DN5781_c0_g1~~TRINITY_DN5781_c0_g1_i1.p2  ORF type:complete len:584 (-),score=179.49 TRINITY_DN5781_c0_g1_i1:1805-3556(-)